MENALEIQGLCKKYTNFSLRDVSFSVPCGSIVGFVGENGAGKTTTIKSVLNVVKPDAGSIRILGHDFAKAAAQAHEEVGVVFDECSFHDWMRIREVAHVMQNIYRSWDAAYFNHLLERFGLAGLTGKKDIIKTYSRGMKMKLSLAVALAHRPKLLILDEATSGLDPLIRDEILDLFLEFIQDEEHSILFSSHITSDIEKAADYLVFIHNGEILLNAAKDELLENYAMVHCTQPLLAELDETTIVGLRRNHFGVDVLVNDRSRIPQHESFLVDKASVEDIMLFTIRGKSA